MNNFNDLTNSEAERLAILAEEAGEIVQIVGKILRHGYDNYHPDNPKILNRQLLEKELGDLMAVVGAMDLLGDIKASRVEEAARGKWIKKLRYTHHQLPIENFEGKLI